MHCGRDLPARCRRYLVARQFGLLLQDALSPEISHSFPHDSVSHARDARDACASAKQRMAQGHPNLVADFGPHRNWQFFCELHRPAGNVVSDRDFARLPRGHRNWPQWRFIAQGDDTTLLVFSELIASKDETNLRVVLHLLHEGPIQVVFTSPAFAEQILERFAELGPDSEQRAVDALISNTISLRGSFAAGNGPVQLNSGLKERAHTQLATCLPDSRLAKIYSTLAGVEPVIFPGRDEELLDDETE